MNVLGAAEGDRSKEQPKNNVLTRASRRKAGLPPPKPLFSPILKREKEQLHLAQPESPPLLEKSLSQHHGNRSDTESGKRAIQRRRRCPVVSQRLPSDRLLGDEESSSSGEEEGSLWVQCDNKSCRKWRKFPVDSESGHELAEEWFCHMHPLPAFQSCSAPEDKWTVSLKQAFKFSPLSPGQLVWTRATTWPPWPAIVSPDPWSSGGECVCEEREGRIYHIEFLGKPRSHLWLPEDLIEPYHSRSFTSLGVIQRSKRLDTALDQADSFLDLSDQERLAVCEYRTDTTKPQARLEKVTRCAVKASRRKGQRGSAQTVPADGEVPSRRQPLTDTTNRGSRKVKGQISPNSEVFGDKDIQSELASRARIFDRLGIPLSLENVVKVACSLVQPHMATLQGNVQREAVKHFTAQDPPYTLHQDTPTKASSLQQSFGQITIVPQHADGHILFPNTSSALLRTEFPSSASRQVSSADSEAILPKHNRACSSTRHSHSEPIGVKRSSVTAPHHANGLSSKHWQGPTSSPAPLAQTSLSLTKIGDVQLLIAQRQSKASGATAMGCTSVRGQRVKSGTKRKGISRSGNAMMSHSIPQYFKQSCPNVVKSGACNLPKEGRNMTTFRGAPNDTATPTYTPSELALLKQSVTYNQELAGDQQVPHVTDGAGEQLLQGECEAYDEMKEIEDMLSLLEEGGHTCTGRGRSADTPELVPDMDIDVMLSDMTTIEGLIQNLSSGQMVQY